MTYNLEIRSLAALETIEAFDWYEQQQPGLGLDFLSALDTFYNHLTQNPFVHSFYSGNIRQGIVGKFPYVVVYEIWDRTIVVYSVFITSRDPEQKKSRDH